MSTPRRPLSLFVPFALATLGACASDPAPQPAPDAVVETAAPDATSASAQPDEADVATTDTPPAPAAPSAAQIAGWSAALEAGRAALARGATREAFEICRDAEAEHGDDPRLRLLAAEAFLERGRLGFEEGADNFYVKSMIADAHARLDEAVALDPDVPGAPVLLARILRWEENPDAARRVLEEHLQATPGDAAAARLLGEMAMAAREWETAARYYGRAFELEPTDGDACLNATIARQWLGAPAEELVEGYLAAARLLPEVRRPLDLLGAFHKGRTDDRLALFRRVLDDNPKAVWARVWIAHIQANEAKDVEAAIVTLREAADLAPGDSSVHYNLGRTLHGAGRFADAVASYVRALEVGTNNGVVEVSNVLDALLVERRGDPSIARKLRDRAYDLLVERNPLEGRFGNNAGLWHRDVSRDYEASLRYYQAAVAAEPEDQDFLNDCALIYQFHLTEHLDRALAMYAKVVALVEDEGQAPIRGYWDTLENLCKYHFETGDYAKVLELAEKRASPDANVGGVPYPSRPARMYAEQARKRLEAAGSEEK